MDGGGTQQRLAVPGAEGGAKGTQIRKQPEAVTRERNYRRGYTLERGFFFCLIRISIEKLQQPELLYEEV